jgi:hypothetical protein
MSAADYLKSLQTKFPQIQTENLVLESNTIIQHDSVKISIEAFVKISKKHKYSPKINQKATETVERFWKRFETKNPTLILNKGFIERLVCFFYVNLLKDEVGQITLNKLFGSKSLSIWERRKDFFYKESEELIGILKKEEKPKISILFKREEELRNKQFNSETGFVICIENTTMFHPESSYCSKCLFTEDCKKFQKNNYPQIYKNRC